MRVLSGLPKRIENQTHSHSVKWGNSKGVRATVVLTGSPARLSDECKQKKVAKSHPFYAERSEEQSGLFLLAASSSGQTGKAQSQQGQ